MADLPECDQEVFRRGFVVFITHSIPAAEVEAWVKKVSALSEQRVDWHYVAGRAVIKAIGDLGEVERAIRRLLPEHDAAFHRQVEKLSVMGMDAKPPRPEWMSAKGTTTRCP